MTIISGKMENNYNSARGNIFLQMPFFRQSYPEISNCYEGTINIRLESDLIIANPDHTTKPIMWCNTMTEVFDFLKIKLQIPRLNQEHNAWLYIPHNSGHRENLNFHEIMCIKIENLIQGEILRVCIENKISYHISYNHKQIYII